MKTIHLNASNLKQHWTRKELPQPHPDQVNALADAIARGTQLPPGYVIQDGEKYLLVAGETRRRAHAQRQVDMEFYVVPTEEQAIAIAIGENTARKQYKFKYQIAWDYCPLAQKVIALAERKKLENLKKGQCFPDSPVSGLSGEFIPKNIAALADRIGVGRTPMTDVMKVYKKAVEWDETNPPRIFTAAEDLSDESKERLKKAVGAVEFISIRVRDIQDPCTPGQALAGLGGKSAAEEGRTQPKTKQKAHQLILFNQVITDELKRWDYWQKFDDTDKAEHFKVVREKAAELPPEQLQSLADYHAKLAAEFRKAAKQGGEA